MLSKQKLIEKIGNKKVNCKKVTIDRYKRVVAECYVNDESLSKYLVKNGYAFAYRRYSKKFVEDENFAKNKLGLWSMDFQYPWDFRRKNNPHFSQTVRRINHTEIPFDYVQDKFNLTEGVSSQHSSRSRLRPIAWW